MLGLPSVAQILIHKIRIRSTVLLGAILKEYSEKLKVY